MPGSVLLVTNLVIAFFSGENAVAKYIQQSEVFVPSTVLGELHYGARKSSHVAANVARIEEFAS